MPLRTLVTQKSRNVSTPRSIAFAAGVSATLGMTIVFFSTSALTLAAGIALAGLSTGLTSPPLATAVSLRFHEANRPKANAIINAGTAVGIVCSGTASLVAFGEWRDVYLFFSVVSCAVTGWVFHSIPARREQATAGPFSFALLRRRGLASLCISSFLMGLSSTAIWTFGGGLLRDEFDFTEQHIAWAWIALGLAGMAGSTTGLLVQRFGLARVHRLSIMGIAAGTAGLSLTSLSAVAGFVSVAVFGAAYIVSSGAYLIQGIKLLADRPDLGLGIPFLVLALGQSSGAPLFGAVIEHQGMVVALATFSGLALLASLVRPRQLVGS